MKDIRPEPLKHRLQLPTNLASIPVGQDFLMSVLRKENAPEDFIRKMRLVLDEALTNAIEHGGISAGVDTISLSCQMIESSFQIQVEDFQGRMFDPEYFRRIAVAKGWGKGGRGILLIDSIVDHMAYLIEPGKHTILYMEITAPWLKTSESKTSP
ncbi:MAG: ATP-binding protein [Candidatus Riflebacteria bacterium]|nr:ATP-binding protein [Candidatus Riflebacteria bacterium]